MKMQKRCFSALACVVLCLQLGPCRSVASNTDGEPRGQIHTHSSETGGKAKNLIIVIGDGMGTAQVYSSIVVNGERSAFLRFPYSGFSITNSADKYTTDSGAGGSAILTGHKVNNKSIARSPQGKEYESVLSMAARQGRHTGIIVTSSILDATPASAYAHVENRKMFDEISLQLAQSNIDFFIGGDRLHFNPQNRKDGRNPLDTLRRRGYEVVYKIEDVRGKGGDKLCALLSDGECPAWPASKRGYWLRDGLQAFLSAQSKEGSGFVLLVEGSQIDWACHNNDTAYLREEMNELDAALHQVLDFAETNGETLVVVTADHETGGLTLVDGSIDEQRNDKVRFISGNHTGIMVPVFAYGPGASAFSGVQQNVDLFYKMMQALSLKQ